MPACCQKKCQSWASCASTATHLRRPGAVHCRGAVAPRLLPRLLRPEEGVLKGRTC